MSSTKNKVGPNKCTENAVSEKLRVLCLHGYRQNGGTFKSKIGKKTQINVYIKPY